MSADVLIFMSYSHLDLVWLKRFDSIANVKRLGRAVNEWTDREITPGTVDDDAIREALDKMDVFVCFVTPGFLDSSYITTVELDIAKKRHKKDKIEIVPVLVSLNRRYLEERKHFLAQFNPLPCHATPWGAHHDPDGNYPAAIQPIREGIEEVVKRVQEKKAAKGGLPVGKVGGRAGIGRRIKGGHP